MSGDQQNTDTTSFASILAGVQKLRQENGGSQPSPPSQQQQRPPQQRAQPVQRPFQPNQAASQSRDPQIGQKRVNAFNQDKTRTASPSAPTNRGPKVSPISVNKAQAGNPLLQAIVNVNWSYVESRNPYDYLVNGRQVLFLSLKYHKLHPEYIGNKMKGLLKKNAILLTVVDVENNEQIIREINKLCLFNEFTLLLAFNFEQAAKYLTFLATTPSKVRKGAPPPEPI